MTLQTSRSAALTHPSGEACTLTWQATGERLHVRLEVGDQVVQDTANGTGRRGTVSVADCEALLERHGLSLPGPVFMAMCQALDGPGESPTPAPVRVTHVARFVRHGDLALDVTVTLSTAAPGHLHVSVEERGRVVFDSAWGTVRRTDDGGPGLSAEDGDGELLARFGFRLPAGLRALFDVPPTQTEVIHHPLQTLSPWPRNEGAGSDEFERSGRYGRRYWRRQWEDEQARVRSLPTHFQ